MDFTAKTALSTAVLALSMVSNQAHAFVKTNLVVQPLAATADAEDLMLHADDNGSTFLYVEQQQGAKLAVYDVTDPAHMKLDAAVETGARSSYDFVSAIGNSELIAFRDGSGSAVIDLRKAKAPKLAMIEGSPAAATELLGTSGYLASNLQQIQPTAIATQPRAVQVVETTTTAPRVIADVQTVTKQVARPETGTTFLLGANGITVVRQINAERQYIDQEELWMHAN
jgi:hypothetical protein